MASRIAVCALVFGILGIVLLPGLFSLLGIIFGIISICRPLHDRDRGYGIAGLVLGVIGLVWIFILIYLIILPAVLLIGTAGTVV